MASERTSGDEGTKASGSPDPDVIVAQIERTREDLAETLDAIVDRVSPKRVADRSKTKIRETVRSTAASARQVLTEKTATAKVAVTEKSATAKEAVVDKTSTAKVVVTEKTATAKGVLADKTAAVKEATGRGAPEPVPPVIGIETAALATDPLVVRPPGSRVSGAGGAAAYLAGVPLVQKQAAAGALAALVAGWLLWRRRR